VFKNVEARSTDYYRTLQSVTALLMGVEDGMRKKSTNKKYFDL
jgi:hypothetical protein